jgi:hypothetical protein
MVAMPWVFEGAEIFTLLSPLCYLRDCHDGTTPRALLTTKLSKTWPLPITSSSAENLGTDVAVLVGIIGATIPSSPCISICITV